jgi:hypothetical protein
MKVKNTALRLAGAAMIAVALAPWVGGSASAVTRADADIFLKVSQRNTDPATLPAEQKQTDCPGFVASEPFDYFHFVLDGDSHQFVEVTAEFSTGNVTLVVDPQSKHAYVKAPTGSILLDAYADVTPDDASIPSDFQLSHVCLGTPTPPSTPPTTPATVTTTPATVASTPAAVLPTKASASPEVSVKGTKTVLPHTGSGVKVSLMLATSLALLLGGGAMMMLPGLAPARGKRRKH